MERAFKPIEADEAAQVETLLRAAFAGYLERLGRGPRPGAYDWLAAAVREGCVYGGYRDGLLIGVAATSRDADGWTLERLAVDPSRQAEGLGGWLLKQVEAEARSAGASALFLNTAHMMTDLIRFYERHGFRETRRALPEHGGDTHLRVYMQKRL